MRHRWLRRYEEKLNMGMLAGKVVVITGAARGLGRAYALDAAREGAAVVVNDIDAEVRSVAANITAAGGQAAVSEESITTWVGAEAIIGRAVDRFGRLDGLVNNAGVLHVGPPWEETPENIRMSLDVNLLGSIYVGIHAMKVMIGQKSGSIVNNSSSGALGAPREAVYAATKGALASLTSAWAVDLAPHGIRVNAYSPSAGTPMAHQYSGDFPPSLATPEDNAPAVTYLLSDASDGITGQVLQRYRDGFMVWRPLDFTDHFATVTERSAAGVVAAFDPVLRAGLQRVGWYGPAAVDYHPKTAGGAD
jgi:NAD(P)-dependent dehydrogenase (short-subunit alcohol dehydrogenase family)